MKRGENVSARAYVTLTDLLRLEHLARGFSFLPRQPAQSLLSGRHASRLRGRGLSFEELRVYRPGDDIRTMDWKATARLRTPQVRVYSEERDRPTILLVDQRGPMFFGSRSAMKSVVAAELATIAAWAALAQGDRVGAVLLGENELVELRPQRSRRQVLRILGELARLNNLLPAPVNQRDPAPVNEALRRLQHLAPHDALIISATDANGLDADGARLLTQLSAHNDVIAAIIYDPLEADLPAASALMASDGESSLEIPTARQFHDQYRTSTQRRLEELRTNLRRLRIPIVPLTTHLPVEDELRAVFGRLQTK